MKTSTHRRAIGGGARTLAVLVAATTLAFTVGAAPAGAAAGDESHASGTYLSASVAGIEILEAAHAEVSNDGLQPTQVEYNQANAQLLQTIEVGGGVQVPVSIVDAGALSSYAEAEADGSSFGASGLVTDDGAVGAGPVGPDGEPSPLTFELSDTLGAAFAAELSDLSLQLGATTATARSVQGGTPVGTYEILGSNLVFTSATLAELVADLNTAVAGLDADIDALGGVDGAISASIVDVLDDTLVGTVTVTGDAVIDVDLATAVAPFLTGIPGDGDTVSFNLANGTVTVDLAELNGGTLNGLAPNTEILTSAQLIAITTALTTLAGEIADDVEAAVTAELNAAVLDADFIVSVDGTEVGTVAADGTIAELLAQAAIVGTDIPGIDPADLEVALSGLVDDFLDPATGALGNFVTDLQSDIVDDIATDLGPVLDDLAEVLRITVNNQDPSPPVAGQVFTETAVRIELLPGIGPLAALAAINVAEASVGPNVVDVAPVIASLDPDEGPETGGTVVTIVGTGFNGTTGVTFDGIPGTQLVVVSDTEITITSPPHAPETVDVVILHPSGASVPGVFTYTPLIDVTDIDPNFGPPAGGTIVDIFGVCFTGATGVTFDGVAGTGFVVIDDTHIVVTSPPHAVGAVDVVVLGAAACGGPVTAPDGFVYVDPDAPEITGIVPDNGPESGGTDVVITGTGFTGATAVTFDGIPATNVVVVTDTTISATSPAHAPGIVGVVVEHPDGNSGPFDFTYTPLISVTEIDPEFGPEAGGTPVTITGACFTGATGVLFDGVAGTAFLVVDDSTITVTTPAGTPGLADVTVLGTLVCGGAEVVPDGFQYIDADAPVLLGLDPDNGPESGGTLVTIEGSGFTGATGATFDGLAGTSFQVLDDGTITVVTPAHPVGPVAVVVTSPDGPSAPLVFVYTPATTVAGVTPGTGPAAGGTSVTITGTCFLGATDVRFGTASAASFTIVDDTTITAVTPAGVGAVDVTVIASPVCGTAALDDGFTYLPTLAFTGQSTTPALAAGLLLLAAGLALAIWRRRHTA